MGSAITPHTQNKRLLRMATPLGDDVLIPLSIEGEEAMSHGWKYELRAMSEQRHDLTPKDLIGRPVTFAIVQEDNSLRYFNGYVTEFAAEGRTMGGQQSGYRLKVEPWLYLLDKGSDCRIFQELSVPDVLKKVFEPLGDIAKITFDLKRPHEPYRYLTQYNETNGNFVRRLLAMDGIGYVVDHENGLHTVRFFDDPNSLSELAGDSTLKLQNSTVSHDHLSSWNYRGNFDTGRFTQRSYSYQEPGAAMQGESSAPSTVTELSRAPDIENYRYAESYSNRPGGDRNTGHVMGDTVQHHHVAKGAGTYRQLQPGRHFSVVQVPSGEWVHGSEDFTFTRVRFIANDREGSPAFHADFDAVLKGNMTYPKGDRSQIASLQSARVTGPKGEEIHTDKLGRIKVMFHWDRDGEKPGEKATCWLRVMQSFAGPGFGAHFTPRIGQEVVVAFENGNPDRPFVLGALYHAEHKPPYASNAGTRAGFRTRTTKGGQVDNCNELYFEDAKGKEEFFIQAERDFKGYIKRNETRRVDNTQIVKVGGDRKEHVGKNDTLSVEKELVIKAGKSIKLSVGGSLIQLTSGQIDIKAGNVKIN